MCYWTDAVPALNEPFYGDAILERRENFIPLIGARFDFFARFQKLVSSTQTPTQLERLHARYLALQMPRQRSNNCMRIERKNSFGVFNLSSDGSGTGCWGGWDARKTWTGSRTCIVQTMERGRAGIQSYGINKSLWHSLIRQTLLIPLKKSELLKISKSNFFHIENQSYQLCFNAAHSVGLVSTESRPSCTDAISSIRKKVLHHGILLVFE